MYFQQHSSFKSRSNPSMIHNQEKVIEVTGEGSIAVTPNLAEIMIGAITENQRLSIAQAENSKIIANVLESLFKLNIAKEQIQTAVYRIEPQYHYEEGKSSLIGYQVTHLLQVTIDNMEKTGLVIDTAVNSGANSVSMIQFKVSNSDGYYHQALSLAVKNARNKAMTIATSLGGTLHRYPLKVEEEIPRIGPVPYQAASFQLESALPPIQAGELNISAVIRSNIHMTSIVYILIKGLLHTVVLIQNKIGFIILVFCRRMELYFFCCFLFR
ncbi:SIMPL domain-containing protein [Caldalkalibacillus mannanilyticus]|uniref:SIMPL domain-containing protein n=1 Tax=Caldalkalibacillus mannanilyticus TaxID=1418 RepID=UPI00131F2545|nr:SIMPL domain-containing protein [Caldalkalibacillus mannanilyticus]